MASNDISHTIPQARSHRDGQRLAVLLLAGTGTSRENLRGGRVVTVGDGLDIGRRPPTPERGTALAIPDRTVSGLHARVARLPEETDGFTITDLGSTNGTFVDGRRLTGPVALKPGALVFVGSAVMIFRMLSPAELAAIKEDAAHPFTPVATLSPTLAMVCTRLRLLAASQAEIFLLGETGVGKEVFARGIHAASGRSGPMVSINCAAIPRELVESELFGYEKGAHSTAQARKVGLIESAQGGTLFLDELGEMPIELQSKLLRFVQDRKFSPLGSNRVIDADVRIIAASSRAGASKGPNVQDALLGRLGAQPVQLPPLRERLEDLARLIDHFLGDAALVSFETEVFQALFLHSWPLNVRELQKTIVEAKILRQGTATIGFEHLPESIVALTASTPDEIYGDLPPQGPAPDDIVADAANTEPAKARRPPPTAEELTALLRHYHGNITYVARHLKRQYAVIWRCLQRYGIDASTFKPPGDRP